MQTLTKRGKKQVVPEGLYDALIAVVDLMQKMVRMRACRAVESKALRTLLICVLVVVVGVGRVQVLEFRDNRARNFLGTTEVVSFLVEHFVRTCFFCQVGRGYSLPNMLNIVP